MLKVKKIPWLSLALLLISYSTLGWVLSARTSSWGICAAGLGKVALRFPCQWWSFALAVALILLLAETLASPFSNLRKFITFSLRSDSRAFLALVIITFLFSTIVSWIHVLAHTCVLFTAALLTRLDLMTASFDEWQAFFFLSAVSLMGFAIGWFAHNIPLQL